MKNPANIYIFGLVGLVVGAMGVPALAAELPAGSVVEKSNVDSIKNDTFEGHTVASLLTEKLTWQIKERGLKITLDHGKPYPVEPRLVELTKKYAGQAKFDPATKEVSGYTAGVPFPEISEADPDAGYKIMWNFYYAPREGDVAQNKYIDVAIQGDKGVEHQQDWIYERFYNKGRWGAGGPVVGDGTVQAKTYVLAQHPEDIKGLGIFGIRHDSAQWEDSWIYLKSARRTRRLSGGAWMDPIGGSDYLNDDLDVFNARPSWYPGMKVVGKRWVLAITDSRKDIYNPAKKGTPEEFPAIDLKNAPYWNPIEKWQPREVYVIEATPPKEHPYSKRLMYVDASVFRPYYSENFDKKGEFWKFVNAHVRPVVSEDGFQVLYVTYVDFIDFKRNHASSTVIREFRVNPKDLKEDHWSVSGLEKLAK